MFRFLNFFLLTIIFSVSKAEDTLSFSVDTFSVTVVQIESIHNSEKKKTILHKFPPFYDTLAKRMVLRNQQAPYGQKVLRGAGLVLSSQVLSAGLLFVMPEESSNWEKDEFRDNFKRAYTEPPVFDEDSWYINYLAHPYQGSLYYNAYRSQGAKFWQASLFCIGHSMMWEYLYEAGFEQPSIQDMIVTPIAGSLLGELFHFSTLRMSRNGFKWYEAAFVSVFNPMYAINNGFKSAKKKK